MDSMITEQTVLQSEIVETGKMSLSDLDARNKDVTIATLQRIIPNASNQQVPVAAFNSAI
jgi:hypothetical protein